MTTLDRVNAERIRELEAGLVVARKQIRLAYEQCLEAVARAEKAEAARDSWRNQAKVQEARVAELERSVRTVYHANPAGATPITHAAGSPCYLCREREED